MNHNNHDCEECQGRQCSFPDITDPETMNKKLQEAVDILSDAGLSFFIAVSGPIKTEGQIKPLSISGMSARPTQSSPLLSSIWAGLGQYMLTDYDSPVTDDTLDALFALGSTEANAVMSMTIRRSQMAAMHEAQLQQLATQAQEVDA